VNEEVVVVKELIKYIAQGLVDNPEEVEVSEAGSEHTVVIELKVAKSDIGKVIGREGHNVQAMRSVLAAASAKVKKRAVLEIIE